jgi:polysaccharide biosynthesis/export protein
MKKLGIYSLIIIAIIQTSCKNVKDITMFQASDNEASSFTLPPISPEHRISPFDHLYIKVLTTDPEVNQLFNPTISSTSAYSSTEQMYGSPTGQYLNGYRVSVEGNVSLPTLGNINLLGLTVNEAQERITETAEEYLKQPIVQVKLLNFKLDILGEVNAPGMYYNYEGSINIIDAVSLANGTTKYANLKKVIVNRELDNITTSYKIDLTKNNIYQSEVFYLQPNDVVYVPPTKLIMRGENTSTYSLLLSTLTSLLVIFTFVGLEF